MKKEHKDLFTRVSAAVEKVLQSYVIAADVITEGRLSIIDDGVTVELQWPWHGGYPQAEHEVRLMIEAKLKKEVAP